MKVNRNMAKEIKAKRQLPRYKPLKSRRGPDLFNFKLTQEGVVMTGAVSIVAGFMVMSPAYNLLVAVFAVYFLSYFLGSWYSPRMKMQGRLPDRLEANREITVRYELTNQRRCNAYDIAVGLF
ncbi:MAG: hypothetical protein JW745_09565, partial [Sedimentisphaerales bacterium]|nr:hypothetical protein [Sedimentisphaerales bacterium]